MNQEPSRCNAWSQTDRFDETEELHRNNNENKKRITYLSKTLEQKDDLIKLLLKEKSILECEKDLLQKEQLSAVREKENIVMRFAIVEKKIIDLKSQIEQAEKREKRLLKECETLNNKLKATKDEIMCINATLDAKCHEHILSLKDIETLKTEISSLETKCRWNTIKLRKEIECKQALEKELKEFQMNLNHNQIPQSDEASLHKIAELKASQIMLAHLNTEQTDKITHLEKLLENVSKELQTFKILLVDRDQEQACICAENNKLHQDNVELQNLLDHNVMKMAELQAKGNDIEALSAHLSISEDANCNLTEHLKYVQKQVTELTDDITKFQKREAELLALNQELVSLNATLQNDISLHGSKSLATKLDNNEENKAQHEYRINKLQEELNSEKKDRFEERLVMARHFTDKSKECHNMQQKLDQALEDLTVMKKKHAMVTKDLQREIASFQKSLLLQQINKTQKKDQITSSAYDNCIDHGDFYEKKEPPISKLIERIVRLQQANNRQAEKIDFLENHSSTLVVELQKKTKIVSHYMKKEQLNSIPSDE